MGPPFVFCTRATKTLVQPFCKRISERKHQIKKSAAAAAES